jgi:hypothetical protein
LAKPNYRHAKKQKEAARKARQDAKQQRRAQAADGGAVPDAPVDAGADPAGGAPMASGAPLAATNAPLAATKIGQSGS